MVRRSLLLSAVVIALALLAPGAGSAAPLGALGDLPGTGACVTADGSAAAGPGTCLADAQLGNTSTLDSVVVSPDGRFVYAADEAGLIALYARDPQTGLLSIPAGTRCWRGDGALGCADYRGMASGDGDTLALSGDGRFLYVTDYSAHPGVLVFSRDASTGALTQLAGSDGCLTADGAGETGICTNIRGADTPNAIRVSADDRFVYTTDFGTPGGVLSFARDTATGTLTQLPGKNGCITSDGTSEDGAGTCQTGRLVKDDRALTVTPDGAHAVVADLLRSGVEVFDRDPQTGVLSVRSDQASCMTQNGDIGATVDACRDGRALTQVYQVAAGPAGSMLYAVGQQPTSGVAVIHLDPQTGELTQPSGPDGCVTVSGSDEDGGTTCTASDALGAAYGAVTSPDGRHLYALNRGTGIDVLDIAPETGLVTPLPGLARCANDTGAGAAGPGRCTTLKAMSSAYGLAFAPDGATAYATDSIRPGLMGLRVEAAPTCSPLSVSTAFATPVTLTLPCRDPNGDALTRQVTSAPSGLGLGPVASDGSLTATPAAGFSGAASFAYTATDGSNTSDPATATVTVGGPIPPAAPAGTADRTKPKVTLGKLRLTPKGVRLTLTLSEAATVRAKLKGHFSTGDKPTELARGAATARAGKVTLTLKRTKAGARLKQLKGKRLKAFRPTLSVTATDAAGNRAVASASKARLTR